MRVVLPGAEGELLEKLAHGGAFLTVGGAEGFGPNTMTIGWGSMGVYWNMDVMTVCVRPQRHTFGLLNRLGEFTVSVPGQDPLREQLAFAGSASGRDGDKFSGHGLTASGARRVGAPIVAECALHFECAVRAKADMRDVDADVLRRHYPANDLHTLYFAEILECYRTKG